jgi:chorismate synthase
MRPTDSLKLLSPASAGLFFTDPSRAFRSSHDTDIMTKGRHDPCVGIRAVPVGEAMVACMLADYFLRHRGQVGG